MSDDVANAAIVKIGDEGKICIYTHVATDPIIDTTGFF